MASKTLVIPGMITVGELAAQLDLPVTKLIGELFKNGIMATVNQKIDLETAQIIVEELGLDVELEAKKEEAQTGHHQRSERSQSDKAQTRPPIVAVMGHVDHGKTSLLDAVLDTKVVSGEAGGITQHISAYQTEYNGRKITLLDTPGHEAFSALRQHGAALTDVVIIVVAADDGVKPQTVEAIKFAQQANARIVVAINKIDKPEADANRVKTQLASDHSLTPEDWGGDTVMVEVSAKTKQNLDKLLELVLLVADLEDLRAEVDGPAEGLVIESHMEQGRGAVVGLLIEHGTLRAGSFIVAGGAYAKIRTLQDYAGRPIKEAGPSTPATVTGFKMLPEFGDRFTAVASEKEARQRSTQNATESKEDVQSSAVSSSDLLQLMNRRKEKQLIPVIVKADVQGSLTSVADSLKLLENDEVALRIISSGVGNISENDVRMAQSSQAIIYGFNIQLPPAVKRQAQRDKVPVRIFRIIYELIDDAKQSLEQMLAPEVVETEIGKLVIKGIFKTTKDEVICGGEVTKGKIEPRLLTRVLRDGEQIAEAEVGNVQRNHQEAKEVFEGEMCGLQLKTKGKLQINEGDKLEFFKRELVRRTL
ncbi:MAG TPA: translation initiation factor IF-2 [Candidatus Saccharimonadales bacterium]|nr:translation initiation factor IF-2 [Candidatus Saccharimonadales bacterium]